MVTYDPSRLVSQLTNFLRDNPRRDEICSRKPNAVASNVFAKERGIKADLSGADKSLAFFAAASEYSIFPRAGRPRYADRLGIYSRMDAWNLSTKQIRETADDRDSLRADVLGATADVFARLPPLMVNGRYPL